MAMVGTDDRICRFRYMLHSTARGHQSVCIGLQPVVSPCGPVPYVNGRLKYCNDGCEAKYLRSIRHLYNHRHRAPINFVRTGVTNGAPC